MHLLILIAVLIANYFILQWVSDGMMLEKLEMTSLFVSISIFIVVVAHGLSATLREDRAGTRLELVALTSALVGVVATGAISQAPEAVADYERARERVVSERSFIREVVNELYDPNCEGWPRRARAMSRQITDERPEIQPNERKEELKKRFGGLDRSCLLLWDARIVRDAGQYKETFDLLDDVAEIGVITVLDDLVRDLKELSSDPYLLQLEAEKLRTRADMLEGTGKVVQPISKLLVLLALSIGVGRTLYFSFKR